MSTDNLPHEIKKFVHQINTTCLDKYRIALRAILPRSRPKEPINNDNDNLPLELKRLIYGQIEGPDRLNTVKSLRQVSWSWAAAGLEELIMPTFEIKSFEHDVGRLLNISKHPILADCAAWKIKNITILDTSSDLVDLRYNVAIMPKEGGKRHCRKQQKQVFQEMNKYEAQIMADETFLATTDTLVPALQVVPSVNTITVLDHNPFKNEPLKSFRSKEAKLSQNVITISNAAKAARLSIQQFQHYKLPTDIFFGDIANEPVNSKIPQIIRNLSTSITNLKSLDLTIEGYFQGFYTEPLPSTVLCHIIQLAPDLEDLSIRFDGCIPAPLSFLPKTESKLRSVSLENVNLEGDELCSFLQPHRRTLKRLSIGFQGFQVQGSSWKSYLADIQSTSVQSLEKFQAFGTVFVPHRASPTSYSFFTLLPLYNAKDDWKELELSPGVRAIMKGIENFVVRDAPYPPKAAYRAITAPPDCEKPHVHFHIDREFITTHPNPHIIS